MSFSEYFEYQENGKSCLIRKKDGSYVGYISSAGLNYWRTMYKRKSYRVHRIIYEITVYGEYRRALLPQRKDARRKFRGNLPRLPLDRKARSTGA